MIYLFLLIATAGGFVILNADKIDQQTPRGVR